MRRSLLSVSLGLALAVTADAGQFTPGLERYLADHPAESSVTVLLAMAQQADIATLDQQLRDNQAELWDRHEQVITLLQNTATESQAELLSELEQLKAAGKVEAFYSHWLVNGIVVHGDVATLRMLASRADVERAETNLEVELIDPVERAQKDVPFSDRNSRVATPGIQAINADDVWNLLSVDGTGALVGILDTGVDGTHPALSSRYRGNNGYPDSECWYDALGGYSTPGDSGYHGTHVMGTICGGAPGEEIGVAPGSQWIASNVIGGGTGSVFDNGVIASLEFMADPDGNPGTINDVPDVVQNSWGVNEGFSGYTDCDTRWWTAIDNCEAAGVCLTWSAGNEGSGSTTLRSPADRATSPYNCFSVGSLLNDGSSISSFSSRGPSGCGGAYAMKPEVMAPGSDIYSAQPGGGYQYLSGTSMAGPHVAGVVALMRAANPNVDVTTIKQILMDTAIDMGTVGEDNDYGHGRIDAYEAVLAVMSGFGTLQGVVTDAGTGSPISGVLVSNTAGPQATSTDGAGAYEMFLAAETYSISYEAFGYTGQTLSGIVVSEDATTTQNVALSLAPTATLYGYVFDPDGAILEGATISVDNAPVSPTSSNASGYYELTIPTGYTYELTAVSAGLGSQTQTIAFTGGTQLDFNLPVDPRFLPSGPDSYGYRIFDSNDAGGVPYQWEDISATGAALSLSDDSYASVSTGFSFNFYGSSYTEIAVGSNGMITMGTAGSTSYSNAALPALSATLFALWDDLNPGSAGTVYTEYQPANGRFVVQYDGVPYYGTSDYNYFQVILLDPAVYPSESGDAQWIVQFQGSDRGSCTVGLESPGSSSYLQYVYNNSFDVNATPYAEGPIALLFSTNSNGFGPVEDTLPPSIVHVGLPDTQDVTGPWTVSATITDWSGVLAASLYYRLPGQELFAVPMTAAGDVYSADIPGPVAIGGEIEYFIAAQDNSENQNLGQTDPFAFSILAPTGLEYCQDFEAGLDDFTVVDIAGGNVWTTATYNNSTTAYIQYSSSTAEDHSMLNSPVFDCSGQATMQLDFFHRLRMGYSGYWSDAWVRGSIDGGLTWPILIAEWHSTDGGGAEFTIEGDESYDISDWAAGEALVAIQFEFHDLYDWYWNVDNVCLTGTLAVVEVDPVDLNISFAAPMTVVLDWQAVPGATSYDVYAAEGLGSAFNFLGNTSSTSFSQAVQVAESMALYRVVTRSDLLAAEPSGNRLKNLRALSLAEAAEVK